MKKITRTSLLSLMLFSGLAHAETLDEAMAKAYSTSPRLQARQAQLRAIDEQVAQANAGWKPTLNGSASYGYSQQVYQGNESSSHPRNMGLQLSQPLLKLQTFTAVQSAKRAVDAARATLTSQEQQLLFDAVSAYMNVVRDQSVLKLQQNNEQVLKRQLDAARDRFRVGEITRTDVSQAESRLSDANAARILAEGNLAASRANYKRVIGDEPAKPAQPETMPVLPAAIDEAIAQAESANPDVVAAQYAYEQADKDVDTNLARLLPEINVVGSATRAYGQSTVLKERSDGLSIGLQATIPLYQGGAEYARTRQAKQTRSQRSLELEETKRLAQEAAIRAWQLHKAAVAAIDSRRSGVKANALALEGIQQEAKVGTRTTLDVLNAEQEYLNAQVNLVSAEHDAVVAAYQVLSAVGKLTAADLKLPVQAYDPKQHYDDVAGKWIGVGGDE